MAKLNQRRALDDGEARAPPVGVEIFLVTTATNYMRCRPCLGPVYTRLKMRLSTWLKFWQLSKAGDVSETADGWMRL